MRPARSLSSTRAEVSVTPFAAHGLGDTSCRRGVNLNSGPETTGRKAVRSAASGGDPAGNHPEAGQRSGPQSRDEQDDPEFTAREFQCVETPDGRQGEQQQEGGYCPAQQGDPP